MRQNDIARTRAVVLAVLLLLVPVASADCARDFYGEVFCGAGRCARDGEGVVWCSRFHDGSAQLTRTGAVLCGKGQCAKTSRGDIFCSSVTGGAVLKDADGHVRCQGRCEPGTEANCENRLADSAR